MSRTRNADTQATEVATVRPAEGRLVLPETSYLERYNDRVAGSFPRDTPGLREILWSIMEGKGKTIDELAGEVFPTEHIVACVRRGELAGLIGEYIAVCLIGPTGDYVYTGSSVLPGQLARLMSDDWYGRPPWRPPLNICVHKVEGKKGQYYYTLVVVPGQNPS